MGRKVTTEDFIERARKVHGDRYDYSKVKYINAKAKVIIGCADHGVFEQSPDHHLRGYGCQTCSGRKKLTTIEFIKRAREVHGDRYGYSKVNYVKNSIDVTIVCAEHGEFQQRPANHLQGKGCRSCSSESTKRLLRSSTETFIGSARDVHGDRYNYSKVNYVDNRTNVTIICPEHGEFLQRPGNHLSGAGCRKCGQTAVADKRRLEVKSFFDRARLAHGDRYDYSKVVYAGAHAKVTIGCREHGEFEQLPSNHWKGVGCPECGRKTRSVKRTKAIDEVIRKFNEVHGEGTYDYGEFDYVRNHVPSTIICPAHGPFKQSAANHGSGQGCYFCALEETARRLIKDCDEVIAGFRAVHGDRYDYSKVEYVGVDTKVIIGCAEHGYFEQTPGAHSSGQGCPSCATSGFDPSERAVLYYLAVTTEEWGTLYKIGISNRTVEDRFLARDFARIRVIKTWQFASGRDALKRETEILRQYQGEKYTGPDVLSSGNSELFVSDILGLDDSG